MIVIGNQEKESGLVSVRLRNGENKNNLDFSDYFSVINELNSTKSLQLWR